MLANCCLFALAKGGALMARDLCDLSPLVLINEVSLGHVLHMMARHLLVMILKNQNHTCTAAVMPAQMPSPTGELVLCGICVRFQGNVGM